MRILRISRVSHAYLTRILCVSHAYPMRISAYLTRILCVSHAYLLIECVFQHQMRIWVFDAYLCTSCVFYEILHWCRTCGVLLPVQLLSKQCGWILLLETDPGPANAFQQSEAETNAQQGQTHNCFIIQTCQLQSNGDRRYPLLSTRCLSALLLHHCDRCMEVHLLALSSWCPTAV